MRKHNYVVGYEGEGQVAYDKTDSIKLLTLKQAKQLRERIKTPRECRILRSVVYKLVKVN